MTEYPDTQREAFKDVKKDTVKLAASQQAVYDCICRGKDTLFLLVIHLGKPVNQISGRVRELVELKRIEDSGNRKMNPLTNKRAIVWQPWTGDKDQLPLFTEPK